MSAHPTAARVFRQHRQPPTGLTSPLYRQLCEEWVHLNAAASTPGMVRRWSRNEPGLAGYRTPAEIVDAIDAADTATDDQILLALLRTAHAGHALAGRTVLQVMAAGRSPWLTAAPTNAASTSSWPRTVGTGPWPSSGR